MSAVFPPTAQWRTAVVVSVIGLSLVMIAAACSGPDGAAPPADTTAGTVRSSGELAYSDGDRPGAVSEPAPPQFSDEEGSESTGPDSTGPDSTGPESLGGESQVGQGDDEDDDEDDEELFIPAVRADGIELLYTEGALGPISLGSTIDQIGKALGPLYVIAEEAFIREGFPTGYSVTKAGTVQFWAVEDGGVITTIMTTNPKVGLESGLRPQLPLVDAVALHGNPTLFLGPELREFASFDDGTGADDGVSVLVAIGQFGGPVGIYPGGPNLGEETVDYAVDNAIIKELWFTVR